MDSDDETVTGADSTVTPDTPLSASAVCSEEAEARIPEDNEDLVAVAAAASATVMTTVKATEAGARVILTLLTSTPAALAKIMAIRLPSGVNQ